MKEETIIDPFTGEEMTVETYEDAGMTENDNIGELMEREENFEDEINTVIDNIKALLMRYDADVGIGKQHLSVEENTQKLDTYWQVGKQIIEFNKKYSHKRFECHKCGYKNRPEKKSCKKCETKLEQQVEVPKYFSAGELMNRSQERDDFPFKGKTLEDCKNFYLLFPDGEYPTTLENGDKISWNKYREVTFLMNLPDEWWHRLLNAIVNRDVRRVRDSDGGPGDIRELRAEIKAEFDEWAQQQNETESEVPL